MLNNNSISISVSDDDSDQLGRKRVRVRRKRKKHHISSYNFPHHLLKFLLRYWMLLILTSALLLLFFEAYRITTKPSFAAKHDNRTPFSQNISTNLNRLDPPRCLKLLPIEELQHLNFPVRDDDRFRSIVENVAYITEKEAKSSRDEGSYSNRTLLRLRTEGTRFNLFTGDQTLEQRDKSFKVGKTAEVHCGFYSEKGGFKISDEDKSYMRTCRAVVSTCAFGGGDDLYQPIGMTDASLQKVCFVAFWDEITLAAHASKGRRVGEDHCIGKWRIIIVKDLPFADQRLNGKIPKMLGHRLFINAKYSIWVDSKSQFRRDPLGVFEALLWRSNSTLAISLHGARSNVYEEATAVVKKHKATPEEVELQLAQYRQDGLPEDKRFNGKKALNEASVIIREHTPLTNLFMCLWFNEVVRFTSRDQLSFPYVLWRLKLLKDINMFPVCIRKDLVNSMGHLRKAKPLTM